MFAPSTTLTTSLAIKKQVQDKSNTQQTETDKQYIDPQAWKKSLQQVIKQHNAVIEALKYR